MKGVKFLFPVQRQSKCWITDQHKMIRITRNNIVANFSMSRYIDLNSPMVSAIVKDKYGKMYVLSRDPKKCKDPNYRAWKKISTKGKEERYQMCIKNNEKSVQGCYDIVFKGVDEDGDSVCTMELNKKAIVYKRVQDE